MIIRVQDYDVCHVLWWSDDVCHVLWWSDDELKWISLLSLSRMTDAWHIKYYVVISIASVIVNGWPLPWCIMYTGASLVGSFIHLVVCLMAGPKPLSERVLHTVRSRASFFKWESPLLSLRSSSSFLCLFPHLPVTSAPPFIFLSVTCYSRQFLCKMWSIHLVFCLLFFM